MSVTRGEAETRQFNLKLTQDEMDSLKRLANVSGQSASGFLRLLLHQAEVRERTTRDLAAIDLYRREHGDEGDLDVDLIAAGQDFSGLDLG